MIILRDIDLIGEGTQRSCYRHPEFAEHCIKIPHGSKKAKRMQFLEAKYFKKIGDKTTPHIATYNGSVETNLGVGECFELVTDANGEISKSLTEFILYRKPSLELIDKALAELYEHLLKHRIHVHDLSGDNIMCREHKNGGFQLVIIDGIGDPSSISAFKNSPPLYKYTLTRRWRRLVRRLNKDTELIIACDL